MLREDYEKDVKYRQLARQAQAKFAAWLGKWNEKYKLSEIPDLLNFGPFPNKGILATYMVRSPIIGLPYQNLYVGICLTDRLTTLKGVCFTARNRETGELFYLVGLCTNEPDSIDVSFSLRWDSFTHEFIHYLDQTTKNRTIMTPHDGGSKAYINNGLEMNAFFHQGIEQMLNSVAFDLLGTGADQQQALYDKYLKDFTTFRQQAQNFAPQSNYKHFTKENLKKYLKRLYFLYVELKRDWPNVPELNELRKSIGDE